jgi:hypothetical protein
MRASMPPTVRMLMAGLAVCGSLVSDRLNPPPGELARRAVEDAVAAAVPFGPLTRMR